MPILRFLCSLLAAALVVVPLAIGSAARAHSEALSIKPLAERQVTQLPEGTLYWRVETFSTLERAQAAAGPWSLALQAADKAWLFTLGTREAEPSGGTRVADVGPISRIEARRYLLRINETTGQRGATTPVHSHTGSEAFFVLRGEQAIRGDKGTLRVRAGEAEAGNGAHQPMQVSSAGPEPLHALVMFVVDADQPFSSPARLP